MKKNVIGNTTMRAIKWLDIKSVTFLKTFDSATPDTNIKRFDQKLKKKLMFHAQGGFTHVYNKFMGGVDLVDLLTGLYKFKLKSKKYYRRIFYHFLELTRVTS